MKKLMEQLGFEGIAIQKEYNSSKEAMAITYSSSMHKLNIRIFNNHKVVPTNFVPVGSIQFCEQILGESIAPDYYPKFLENHLHRKVWTSSEWPLGKKVFIKPADKHKRFTGFITNRGYRKKKRGPYWCSEVVKFTNEWRYYVADGKILTGEWYSGDEIDCPDAPLLNIKIPSNYCGALDFGIIDDKFALVEANSPYACGWYGKNHDLYTEWIIKGWKYMTGIIAKK
jgi:hypothetical protein